MIVTKDVILVLITHIPIVQYVMMIISYMTVHVSLALFANLMMDIIVMLPLMNVKNVTPNVNHVLPHLITVLNVEVITELLPHLVNVMMDSMMTISSVSLVTTNVLLAHQDPSVLHVLMN